MFERTEVNRSCPYLPLFLHHKKAINKNNLKNYSRCEFIYIINTPFITEYKHCIGKVYSENSFHCSHFK